MAVKEVALFVVAAASAAGCSFVNSRWYPKDFDGDPVGQYAVECWEQAGEDAYNGRLRAVPGAVGAVLATANEVAELGVRGVTNAAAQASEDVPVLREATAGLDYGLNTTADSLPGGRDFDDSYGKFFGGLMGGDVYRAISGWAENSYERVGDRISFETDGFPNKSPGERWRRGIEGTYKTAVKGPASWWLFIKKCCKGGKGKGAAGKPQPGNPVGPF